MHTITTEDPVARIAGRFARLATPDWQIDGGDAATRAHLEGICRRPEMRLLARGITFRIGDDVPYPFVVGDAALVCLSTAAVGERAALVAYVRHALEIAIWHRLQPQPRAPEREVAAAAVACCTVLHYLDALPEAQRDAALAANPRWFQYLARLFQHRSEREIQLAAGLVGFCSRLLPLQGADPVSVCGAQGVDAAALRLALELLPAAPPTERLLGSGGDSRLAIDLRSRLNKYGCSTAPRPSAITFSSCTASSTSDLGYWSAEDARQALIRSILDGRSFTEASASLVEQARAEIEDLLGTASVPGAEIVLAASGTDCELFALHAALEGHDRELLSIVIGPEEIGSGSVPAASGRHFDKVAPLTYGVAAGAPVEGLPVERVSVHTLRLRNETGAPLPLATLDDDVRALATAAVADGRQVLLHVVDSSKTGMRGPGLAVVRELTRELGDRLTVLIDAAQMRTEAERLMASVADGAMVMISGSKFFTGAPFSGALIMPPALARRMRDTSHVPAGFAAYITGLDVPPTWTRFREELPADPNLGLLMRWRTALVEMQAFHLVPIETRNEWFRRFRDAAAAALATATQLQRLDAPVGDRADAAVADWDAFPTIFTFFLREHDSARNASRLLDYEEAWEIYLALNRDIGALLPPRAPAEERELASVACHVGQPVKITDDNGRLKGALRVAVGGRYISRLAFDGTIGATPDERLASQLDDLRRALAKTELIVRHWTHLRQQCAVA